MSLFIKNIFLVQLHVCLILAILYPTSLANLVVEVGTRHSHQTLLTCFSTTVMDVRLHRFIEAYLCILICCLNCRACCNIKTVFHRMGISIIEIKLSQDHLDGLVQERRNSIANALEFVFLALSHRSYLYNRNPWTGKTFLY